MTENYLEPFPIFCAPLSNRSILRITGPDVISFLQGLLTQDITRLHLSQSLYSLFLTPQGKFLHDVFLSLWGENEVFLECETERLQDLKKRLLLYRLRSRITLEDVSEDFALFACFGESVPQALGLPPIPGATRSFFLSSKSFEIFDSSPLSNPRHGKIYGDPRHLRGGARLIIPLSTLPSGKEPLPSSPLLRLVSFEDYDVWRLRLGFPDGARDMTPEKAIPLEYNLDQLHGISFQKGCYLGQELTARTKHRGLIRKRSFPVEIVEGPLPLHGTSVMHDGQEVGKFLSACHGYGLVRLRLETFALSKREGLHQRSLVLKADQTLCIPFQPPWMVLEPDGEEQPLIESLKETFTGLSSA